ncbi:hydroxymethylbilane synthase [Nesterenkonia massiliensis]|uniref:Porphobilinogen deaminase n=1 Tax=Nesterenkonia massiliensis TaxID=1232429 RepID=A0ABT2HRS0_9MICC|nr:hydroxymethylbilane synthase [Nesterenkonia massiliensis]MCT1607367.1 hydroxymethylbilane synthase [Nesterenkonia massiliensis]
MMTVPAHNSLFRVGTRGSKLALTQTTTAAEALAERSGLDYELVTIKSEGDVLTGPLSQLGGTGVFATALRQALFDERVDVAVHSLKDLPAKDLEGLTIAAVPAREDVRDALCSADDLTLEELPEGAKVGTGSPRRAAQLLAARPDLQIVDIRGNVGTRLARVRGREAAAEASSQAPDAARGDLDAVVLAGAGLRRLGLEEHISELLDPAVMLPAPGQGALAVEVRSADAAPVAALGIALAQYESIPTRLEVTAERALLARLNAGCAAPIGGLARCEDEPDGGVRLRLDATVCAPDGSEVQQAGQELTLEAGVTREAGMEAGEELGRAVAETLLEEDTGLLKHVVDS